MERKQVDQHKHDADGKKIMSNLVLQIARQVGDDLSAIELREQYVMVIACDCWHGVFFQSSPSSSSGNVGFQLGTVV